MSISIFAYKSIEDAIDFLTNHIGFNESNGYKLYMSSKGSIRPLFFFRNLANKAFETYRYFEVGIDGVQTNVIENDNMSIIGKMIVKEDKLSVDFFEFYKEFGKNTGLAMMVSLSRNWIHYEYELYNGLTDLHMHIPSNLGTVT